MTVSTASQATVFKGGSAFTVISGSLYLYKLGKIRYVYFNCNVKLTAPNADGLVIGFSNVNEYSTSPSILGKFLKYGPDNSNAYLYQPFSSSIGIHIGKSGNTNAISGNALAALT